jgi:hypothetical protein
MSQLAHFTELPIEAVQQLVPAAFVRKRFFRKPISKFQEYLERYGKDLGGFDCDGFFIVLTLMYLREFANINLLDANRGLSLMALSLTKHQGAFFAFFTEEDRDKESIVRSLSFDANKLQNLCHENEIDCERYGDIGMLNAARECIANLLSIIPNGHVILLCVG